MCRHAPRQLDPCGARHDAVPILAQLLILDRLADEDKQKVGGTSAAPRLKTVLPHGAVADPAHPGWRPPQAAIVWYIETEATGAATLTVTQRRGKVACGVSSLGHACESTSYHQPEQGQIAETTRHVDAQSLTHSVRG